MKKLKIVCYECHKEMEIFYIEGMDSSTLVLTPRCNNCKKIPSVMETKVNDIIVDQFTVCSGKHEIPNKNLNTKICERCCTILQEVEEKRVVDFDTYYEDIKIPTSTPIKITDYFCPTCKSIVQLIE